jgi:hypothetical protein
MGGAARRGGEVGDYEGDLAALELSFTEPSRYSETGGRDGDVRDDEGDLVALGS